MGVALSYFAVPCVRQEYAALKILRLWTLQDMNYGRHRGTVFRAESLRMAGREPTVSHLDRLIAQDGINDSEDSEKDIFKIGDLAKEFNVTLRTLRFYEDRGLITPKRSGSTRLYSVNDRSRLRLILLAKRVGFSLIEIHELMEIYDLGDQNNWHLQLVLDKFRGQMDVLVYQEDELKKSMNELSEIITSLEEML